MKSTLSPSWILGLLAGVVLTLMINFNSHLAKITSPLFASWTAHGIGTLTAILIIYLNSIVNKIEKEPLKKIPLWSYFGGIPGAFTVILAVIAVNTTLGLSGTLSLMLVGQIIFGIFSDLFGLFGTTKKSVNLKDFFVIFLILTGSWLIINFRT
ncbi:DMT family transporter [Pigmentibacter sp. JX0631]|uniref:DMT family transporter n=1 Tax=Pigmentibacter sp. JX0631 TaxID=2976982 RepID=UPI002469B9D0|nr:DMT family transporter [Pigmentibacter sp. JX0631]WGL58745.1 DMT family transporter [Pigmentibacter sp. JX0631]